MTALSWLPRRKKENVIVEDTEQIKRDLSRPLPRITPRLVIIIVLASALLLWSLDGAEARPRTLIEGIPNMVDFVSRLMPPQFEFEDGSVRAYTLFPPGVREPEEFNTTDILFDINWAREDDLAAVEEGQVVETLYRTTDDMNFHYSPEGLEGEVEEKPFIRNEDEYLYIDEASSEVYALPEGTRFVNRYAVPEGQQLVARRYLIYDDEILVGWPTMFRYVVETVQMALIGTIGTIFLSIPFGLLAARNVTPSPAIYQGTRLFLNANRAIPELVYGIIFVGAVGPNAFAGVLALMVGSIGSMGKLFAESIEAIDPDQVAAVRATGASGLQVFNYAVIPQAFPLIASYSLLVFESNVRAATILGLVGAGGVGLIIQTYLAQFQYQRLMGATIIIIIVVTLIDRLSNMIRKRII